MSAISSASQSKVKKLPPDPVTEKDYVPPMKKKLPKNPEDCIKVYCRVRPPEPNEESAKGISILEGQHTMVFMNDDSARPISKKYTFTELFKDESQDHVIRKLCDPVLDAVKNQGKGGLIFTYGVTNSGKTHTVLGNDKEPGIVQYLFANIPKPFELTAVEVYNEQFFTLLQPRTKIQLIEFSGRLEFKDYSPIQVTQSNLENIIQEIKLGRSQRSTSFNSKSSRSHAVIRIKAYGNVIGVVDLAGSERVREGCSQEETTNINCSLLTLGRCIKCLREVKNDKQIQIPFRESRLTMALAEYFNPDFKLVMVININPSKSMINETMNVLEYAAIARDIKPSQTPAKSRYRNITSHNKMFLTLEETKSQDFDAIKKSPVHNLFSNSKMQSERDQNTYEQVLQQQNRMLRQYIVKTEMQRLRSEYYDRFHKNFQEADKQVEKYIKNEREFTNNYLNSFSGVQNRNYQNVQASIAIPSVPVPQKPQIKTQTESFGVNTTPIKERLSEVKQQKQGLQKQFDEEKKQMKRQIQELEYSLSFHKKLHNQQLQKERFIFNQEKKELEEQILDNSQKKRYLIWLQKYEYQAKIGELMVKLEQLETEKQNKIIEMEKEIEGLRRATIDVPEERKSGIIDMITSPFKSVKKGLEVVMRKLSPSKPQIRAQSCEQNRQSQRENRKVHFNDQDQINQLQTIEENNERKSEGRPKSRGKSLDRGKSKRSNKSKKNPAQEIHIQEDRTPLKDRLRPRKKH